MYARNDLQIVLFTRARTAYKERTHYGNPSLGADVNSLHILWLRDVVAKQCGIRKWAASMEGEYRSLITNDVTGRSPQ
jgi:hypothetical protein